MDTTARTPAFHLKMRIVDPSLDSSGHYIPFSFEDFRITWGTGKPTVGKLQGDGTIDVLVDGDSSISGGTLEIGKLANAKFTPKIVIPLVRHTGTQDFWQTEDLGTDREGRSVSGQYKAHDIEWRLVNLMFLPTIPSGPVSFGLPLPPSVHKDTEDAVRRFKAARHADLGIDNWLDGKHTTLLPDQDDKMIVKLLELHDDLSTADAQAKLDKHNAGTSWDPL